MKRLFLVSLVVCVAFLAGCATANNSIVKSNVSASSASMRNMMIGTWLGEMNTEDGDVQQWVLVRRPDGLFAVHFCLTKANEKTPYREQKEVGTWGVSGPIYFTITEGILEGDDLYQTDLENPLFYDAYEILSLDRNSMKYRSFDMDVVFEINRVDDDFELPLVE